MKMQKKVCCVFCEYITDMICFVLIPHTSGIAQLWGPAFTESNTECLLAFWAYISNNLTLCPTMHHIELDLHTNLEKLDNVVMLEDSWNR